MPARTRLGLCLAGAIVLDLLVWGGATRTITGAHVPLWLPIVATILAHQSLWLLRSRPHHLLAVQSALALVSLLVPMWQPFAGLLIAAYAAPAQRGARATYPLLAAALLCLGSHSYASARLTASPFSSTATLLLLWGALVGAIWGLGVRSHQRGRHALLGTHLLWARAERHLVAERLRIARDLHDGVSGAVTAIQLQAAGARSVEATRPDVATRSLAAIESSAERTLMELRRVVGSLRTSSPGDTPDSLPTLAELPHLVDIARQAGLRVALTEVGTLPQESRLDPVTEGTVVRTVQESLTNALKHAGPGTACRVRLAWADGALHLDIESRPVRTMRPPTGELPPGWSAHQGLAGLVERAGPRWRPPRGWAGRRRLRGPAHRADALSGHEMTIRVLVVDDEALVRSGIAMLLQPLPDIEVVGEAPDGAMPWSRRRR